MGIWYDNTRTVLRERERVWVDILKCDHQKWDFTTRIRLSNEERSKAENGQRTSPILRAASCASSGPRRARTKTRAGAGRAVALESELSES